MRRRNIAILLVLPGLAACEPVVEAGERTPARPPRLAGSAAGPLVFARFAQAAPPTTVDTGFWAVRGVERVLELRHRGAPPGDPDAAYLRFRVPAGALARRPDGTQIPPGDSIRIRVVVDTPRLVFDFGPNGLRFAEDAPAAMTILFDDIDPDLDRNGAVDAADEALRARLAIWRQRRRGAAWRQLPTARPAPDVVEAAIPGFSRFALASN